MISTWPNDYSRRLFLLALGLALLLGAAAWNYATQPTAVKIAQGLLGDEWYRIELDGDHVGYMHNEGSRDPFGRWHFRSHTHFLLAGGAPSTIHKHLVFAARAPYQLIEARYDNQHRERQQTIAIDLSQSPAIATLTRDRHQSVETLDWDYALSDFVGFETWLEANQPNIDAEHRAYSPNFERLRITPHLYRVADRTNTGYVIETRAPYAATRTQLDSKYRPTTLKMAGLFDVIRSSQDEALSVVQLAHYPSYVFPLSQRLADHTNIANLALSVVSDLPVGLPASLDLNANPILDRSSPDDHQGEELDYPVSHPAIQKLLSDNSLVAQIEPEQRIKALVELAHRQLRYTANAPAGSVLAALRQGAGECTDYAQLFTTLARAAGYPTRTVYGLAYHEDGIPSLMFHAWNEVYADGWQAVDPTWNQTRVDATHIPLTHDEVASLVLADNAGEVRFEVLDHRYF